eukprot:scaffold38118_cov32-Tisochrysis_lutea.AAC.1
MVSSSPSPHTRKRCSRTSSTPIALVLAPSLPQPQWRAARFGATLSTRASLLSRPLPRRAHKVRRGSGGGDRSSAEYLLH